ncbi:uncharacterized protein TEOVI_000842900 [Trypanosoma equiperdum]|uniref:Trypanosomal VSG domain containing protein n=1 Tax=Trypanosoma equiperdum TaxID=5694 RepID=A0A1G4IAA2_TRYEQ|nr:hypothetical protein TEOVI_000842900 [Trypanosoma equiperdum]
MNIYLVLLLLASKLAAPASTEEDQAASSVMNLCHLEFYLNKMKENLQRKLSHYDANLKALRHANLRYRLASAAATDVTESCLIAALEAKAAELLEAEEAQQQTTKHTVSNAIQEVQQQLQTSAAAIALANSDHAVNTPTNAKRLSDPVHTVTAEVTGKMRTTLHCEPATSLRHGKISGHVPKPAELLKLPYLNADKLHTVLPGTTLTLTFSRSCAAEADSATSLT